MMYNYTGWGYGDYGFGLWGVLGGLVHILFWVLVVVLIIRLLKRGRHGGWNRMWNDRGALGMLRERYAKGEISKEEYEEKKKVLES